jgi:hypothetical protein
MFKQSEMTFVTTVHDLNDIDKDEELSLASYIMKSSLISISDEGSPNSS